MGLRLRCWPGARCEAARISLLRCFLRFESDTNLNDLNIKPVLNIAERLDCIPSVMVDIIPSTNKYEYIKLKRYQKGRIKHSTRTFPTERGEKTE